jgi:DNA-binding transcriptional ArsR family regulator
MPETVPNQSRADRDATSVSFDLHGDDHKQSEPESPEVDPGELLSILSNEYVRAIMAEICDEALPAREIAQRLDISRTTVYRRLEWLEEAGMLWSTMSYESDGHHRKRFQVIIDNLSLSVTSDGISIDDIDRSKAA